MTHDVAQAGDHSAGLEASLALAAQRVGDPTGLVYARLFALYPAMQAEFWRDTSGSIRGEMLARTFEAALDLAGANGRPGGAWTPAFLATEASNHAAYGIAFDVFEQFLPIVAAVICEACGEHLTSDMTAAWAEVLNAATHALAGNHRCD